MSITIKADGSVMVDNVQDAAAIMRLINIGNKMAAMATVLPVQSTNTVPQITQQKGTSARDLLRAGGFTAVREPTLKLYEFMLTNHHRAWTAIELSPKLNRASKPLNNMLSKLARKGILARVGFAQYKAK